MKPANSRQKFARNSKRIPDHDSAAGPNGQAIAPPAYGIDTVDNQVIQTKNEPAQAAENRTGLPDKLKAGIEALSGLAMDDVRVHYNSPQPAHLRALAYTQGTDIHVAPGQEKHLPHEAWHVVQQKQERVRPTMQMKGNVNVNDDVGLEKEADVMGTKALQMRTSLNGRNDAVTSGGPVNVVQRNPQENLELLRTVSAAVPDPSYQTEGSKGKNIRTVAEQHFVTNEKGTWHHIYPRNLLKSHLANISRYFVAIAGEDAKITETGKSHNQMELVGTSISMDTTGALKKPAHYYWKDGNGFLGIRSDRRVDDPGSLVEHSKPPSMSSAKYQLPRDWGKELEKLSETLGSLGRLANVKDMDAKSNKIEKEAGNVAKAAMKLDDIWPYRTVDKEGKDWIRQDANIDWGSPAKNYKMVE